MFYYSNITRFILHVNSCNFVYYVCYYLRKLISWNNTWFSRQNYFPLARTHLISIVFPFPSMRTIFQFSQNCHTWRIFRNSNIPTTSSNCNVPRIVSWCHFQNYLSNPPKISCIITNTGKSRCQKLSNDISSRSISFSRIPAGFFLNSLHGSAVVARFTGSEIESRQSSGRHRSKPSVFHPRIVRG